MTPQSLQAWMDRIGLNRTGAASALGISRNTLQAYLEGKYPIPKTVALACSALAMGIPEHG
jgi:plasmid maintenance system antidote protein VapI